MRILLTLLIALGSTVARADTEQQGFELICNGKDVFSISAYNVTNDVPDQQQTPGSTTYLDYKEHHTRCVLGTTLIEAEFRVLSPQAQGRCGVDPGGLVSIRVNGKSIIENSPINECITPDALPYLGRIEIRNYYARHAYGCTAESPSCHDGYFLKLCGAYTKRDNRYIYGGIEQTGCVSTPDVKLSELPLPLGKSGHPYASVLQLLLAR